MQGEKAVNGRLAECLRRVSPRWASSKFLVEESSVLEESPGYRPDILIISKEAPPISIETSFNPKDADDDAIARIGKHYLHWKMEIKTSIAVQLDKKYKQSLKIRNSDKFMYALHQKAPDNTLRRFPTQGYIEGTVHDLAVLAASTTTPKEDIEKVATSVCHNVKAAANLLDGSIPEVELENISSTLYKRSSLAGLHTTTLLWLNAFLVQRSLSRNLKHNIPIPTSTPRDCVSAWKKINEQNWRAIFDPAIRILARMRQINPVVTKSALERLINAVEDIEVSMLGHDVHIGAELFPKLISEDRKKSAAFYTQPSSAEFLAALTIKKDMVKNWNDCDLFEKFKVGDIACGTGTLLRFSLRQIRLYSEQDGGDEKTYKKLHKSAMETGLYGTDISPIAAHLTSSSLAMMANNPYGRTHIGWVGVGSDNRTGSIEYMGSSTIQDLFAEGFGTSAGNENDEVNLPVTIRDGSMSVIIMNPPYSRTRKGQSTFDLVWLSKKERRLCQNRWGELIKNEPCKKTAGMAATYLCIAKKKIKAGGRIGFVLPRTAALSDSWVETRDMIETEFEDITVVGVAAGRALGKNALSADTNMEEMFLTATKKQKVDGKASDVRCVTLFKPIEGGGEAGAIAKAVAESNSDGDVILGTQIGISFTHVADKGKPWSSLDVTNSTLNVIKNGLLQGKIIDAEGVCTKTINVTTLKDLFKVGPTHHLIGHKSGNKAIGAFEFNPIDPDNKADVTSMYRSLWESNYKIQKSLLAVPTHKGTVQDKTKANKIWEERTLLFYQRNMTWSSQSLVAAMTKNPAVGGRAWLGLYHDDENVMKAFSLWANSIYGMIVYWATGARSQQDKRSSLQVKGMSKIVCPDFANMTKQKLGYAGKEFDTLKRLPLKPAWCANIDPNRKKINHVVSSMLGVTSYDTDTLVDLWCNEPSIKKSNRRKGRRKSSQDGCVK